MTIITLFGDCNHYRRCFKKQLLDRYLTDSKQTGEIKFTSTNKKEHPVLKIVTNMQKRTYYSGAFEKNGGDIKYKPETLPAGRQSLNKKRPLKKVSGKDKNSQIRHIESIPKDSIMKQPPAADAAVKQLYNIKELSDYRYILDQASIVAITDQKGIITYVNENFCKISKYDKEELLGQDHRILNSGYHPASYIRKLWTTIANGKTWRGEFCNRAKDGSVYWVDNTIIPLLDEKKKPYQYVSIRKDITDQKITERDLHRTQLRFEQTQAIANLSNWEIDLLNGNNNWSDELYRIYGVNKEDVQPSTELFLSFIHPDDAAFTRKMVEETLSCLKDSSISFRFIRKDGVVRHGYSEWHFEFDQKRTAIYLFVILQDITERKEAEEALRRMEIEKQEAAEELRLSEISLKQAQALAHISNWEIDMVKKVHTWSDEFYRIYGIKKVDVQPSAELFLSFMHPDDAEFAHKMVNEALVTFKDSSFNFRFIRKDGILRHGYTEWRFEFDQKGIPRRLFGILQDITERKEAEEKLLAAHNQLLFHIENSPLGFIEWDNEIKPKSWSKRAKQLFGWSESETTTGQLDWFSKVYEDDLALVCKIAEDLVTGKIERITVRHRNYTRDGRVIWCEWFNSVLKDENGKVITIMSLVSDITEKVKSEEALRKMEQEILHQKIQEQKKITRAIIGAQEKERNRIGQELHDNINQILACTKMYLKMATDNNEAMKELVKYPLELIDSSIREIRLLSSHQVTPLKDIDLQELVKLQLDKLRENTGIQSELAYNMPDRMIDDDLKLNIYRIIQEQINNIVKYAEAKNIRISIHAEDKLLRVRVEDDGKGFDVKKKRKGIGISNMMNRVESFNGDMFIDSFPGKGCNIEIVVPY